MNGLALWPAAGPNTRAFFIRLACDGDRTAMLGELNRLGSRLTVAQALEVLDD